MKANLNCEPVTAMKAIRTVSAIIILSAFGVSVCNADGWMFKTTEEDWGKTCFAETRLNAFEKLGVMGAKGGGLVAYISSEKDEFASPPSFRFHFNGGDAMQFTGGVNDYFGHFEFDSSAEIIQLLSHEKSLAISGGSLKSVNVSLAGSAAAIREVRSCVD